MRERFVMERVLKTVSWSPAVGIYGVRQVGKSTLVESVVDKKNGVYETFDRGVTLASSQNRPREFCERDRLLCIDECQKGPWIFPVIKDIVGTRRKPGRYLLTGSVRFTLKKEIQEALTGRIILFELLPFTLAEATHRTASSFLQTCFDQFFKAGAAIKDGSHDILATLEKNTLGRNVGLKQAAKHLIVGGMPIPCFSRDAERRTQWREGFFETLITRDLALVDPELMGILPAQGLSFLKRLALMQGEELNYSALAGASALSLNKAKRLLHAFVALCLIDLVVPEAYAAKSQKKMRVEWKDSGLWNHFAQIAEGSVQDEQAAMSLLLSQELRFQCGVTKHMTQWTYYKSHNGANVPWIYRQGKHVVALMYLPTENPTRYHYRALKQFVAREPRAHGIILGAEKTLFTPLDHRILLMPFTAVL